MSDDNYTPTTEQVREAYMEGTRGFWHPFPGPAFDRWLAAHDAEVRAEQREKDAHGPRVFAVRRRPLVHAHQCWSRVWVKRARDCLLRG